MSTTTTTYSLKREGYDSAFCTRIAFTVREGEDRAVMIKHHSDPSDPAKYSPQFHINVEGVEKIIYSNIWVTPEFAARVWAAFTTPVPTTDSAARSAGEQRSWVRWRIQD